jgi:hypothetical protein
VACIKTFDKEEDDGTEEQAEDLKQHHRAATADEEAYCPIQTT